MAKKGKTMVIEHNENNENGPILKRLRDLKAKN